METQILASERPSCAQMSFHHTPVEGARPPRFNALKHGLRSRGIVLPGEDPAEFQRLRHDLFRSYQPRTWEEARCVELMAGHEWRMARCRRWQDCYDGKHDDVLHGGAQGADGDPPALQHCETDPHRWLHKSVDCALQEGRIDRLLSRATRRLLNLQEARRRNLIVGVIDAATDWRVFEQAGAPLPSDAPGPGATPSASAPADAPPVMAAPAPEQGVPSGSSPTGKPNADQRTPGAETPPLPRRERRRHARQMKGRSPRRDLKTPDRSDLPRGN